MRLAVLALVVGCARLRAPEDPTERALFRDLEREVTVTSNTTGWGVDRIEIEPLLDGTLDSVCRVDTLGRRSLADWLDAEIRRLGGPVEVAYKQRGKSLDAVDDLVTLTRIQKLLARAEELTSDCPFWLEPELPFRGRQISEHRWQLTFGGGGKASVVVQGERRDLSFGGAGRILLGRMFADGDGIYLGAELGASATFPKDEVTGMRGSLKLGADFVVPLVYRYTLTNAYFEFEGGWLGHTTEQDWGAFDHGIHLGVGIGARALRTRILFPGAAFGLYYERQFVAGADVNTLKLGLRVAFDLDL